MIVAQWSHIEYQLIQWLALGVRINSPVLEEMLYELHGSRARLDAIHAGLISLNSARMGLPVSFPGGKQVVDRRKKALELRRDILSKLLDTDTGDLVMIERMKLHEWRRLPINELKHDYDLIKELSDKIELIVSNELLQLLPNGARKAGGQPPAP